MSARASQVVVTACEVAQRQKRTRCDGVMGLKITKGDGERCRVTWEKRAAAGSLMVHDRELGFYSKCTPVFKSDLFYFRTVLDFEKY